MIDEIDKAALKAIEKTNLCMKHMEYHGQKYKSCTPQKRVMIKLTDCSIGFDNTLKSDKLNK